MSCRQPLILKAKAMGLFMVDLVLIPHVICLPNCRKPRAEMSAINKEDEAFGDDDAGSLLIAECCGDRIVFS